MIMKFEKFHGEIFLAASKVGERHSALVQNIGTYATEDEAYETLNTLCIALPLTVVSTWILDALLAAAYLNWFHPWRILLQEVTAFLIQF